MKILVVEDERIFATTICIMLEELGYEQVQVVDNAEEAMRLFMAFSPDVVLMDIRIKGDKDGIAVAEYINQSTKPVPVIFMTSLDDKETFERAKNTNPIAYLIKPFDEGTLERTIELSIYKYYKATWDTEIFSEWSKDVLAPDSFFVKVNNKLEKILIQDIVFIMAESKYVELHVAKQKMLIRLSLNDLIEKLPVETFVRVSRSHIINTKHIQNIDLTNNKIELTSQTEVLIGKTYKDNFLDRLRILQ
jgi:DNA-binding LytR/AlgR family response regulator